MASEETKIATDAADEQPTPEATENNNTPSAQTDAEAGNAADSADVNNTDNATENPAGNSTENSVVDADINSAEAATAHQGATMNDDETTETADSDATAETADAAQNQADDSTANQTDEQSQPEISAAGFETEATAPEIAAYDEVHSESDATTDAVSDDATNETPNAETDLAASEQAAAPDAEADATAEAGTETETTPETQTEPEVLADASTEAAQTETSETAETEAAQAEPEQPAKKENVVVKKLTRNPNAKPAPVVEAPAQTQSAPTAQPPAGKSAPAAKSGQAATASRRPASFAPPEDPQTEGMDFGDILKQFEQEQQEAQAKYREGTLVDGTVVGISDRGVMIDFGYKSEGMVAADEFKQNGEMSVAVGDATQIVVKRLENPEGVPELSRAEAVKIQTWDALEKASEDNTTVKGIVTDKTKGGLTVDINGIEAFLPGSQIESRPPRSLDGYKGMEIEARVIKFSRKRGNVVLSRKILLDEVNSVAKAQTMANIAEGYVIEGKVKSLTEYGAFVDLGGIDGLLHVTDMTWGKLDRPSDMLKPNDDVQVKILKIDRDKERISLGAKQLIPNPWSSVEERYGIGSKHIGKVSSTTDYGAFVELEPGVEGLVHVSEMTWSKRAKHPNKIVSPGQKIEVQVLRIDQKDRRVSLGMRQVMSNPWETIQDRYPVGARVKGRVRNMTDFGAFIELEEGVDGLVHLTDITHSKKLKHPSDVLKKNQEVEAVVTGINIEGRRMSLSMRDLQPSAWDAFVLEHKPGDVVRGKISRFANFGVFVELGDELEGLCHISELSDERIEKPEKVFEIGQEMDFKILRIEPDVQKIGLSARAVGKEDDTAVDTKSYSTEAKGGMASLGELANLRNLRGSEDN